MKRILTVGEPMALFTAQEEAPLEAVHRFVSSVAGAEFNVAVGLTRLGHRAGYCTKLGQDPFGRQILRAMREAGIDPSLTVTTAERFTGFMFKSRTSRGDPDIFYYRRNSAASSLCPADLSGVSMDGWDALHMTGIFPALSASAEETAVCLMSAARAAGKAVFFDPNLRPQLWESREKMVGTVNALAALADYVMPGIREGELLCGSADPRRIGEFYLGRGARCVLVKTGADGAWAVTPEGAFHTPAFRPERIVDTVGAGDGFAAGIISGVLEGLPLADTLRRACAIGAIQLMNPGDNEGLPTRAELADFLARQLTQ